MQSTRVARAALDWGRVQTKLGLPKETITSLQTFRARADAARRQTTALQAAKADVDFNHYRSVLKNKTIVDEAEQLFKSFKPEDYDVTSQVKAIDAFKEKALESAKATAVKIDAELGNLEATLQNIEGARPFDQLSVDEIIKARPEIGSSMEEFFRQGKWSVPGYHEKFPNLNVM